MTVTINLPSEAEHQLRAAAARRGCTLEDYVAHLLVSSAASDLAPPPEKSADEWVAEFRTWAANHGPVTHLAENGSEQFWLSGNDSGRVRLFRARDWPKVCSAGSAVRCGHGQL